MTIESPDSMPGDEPQGTFADGGSTDAMDGEIPGDDEGVGVGTTDEPNTFEPEEAGEGIDEDEEDGAQ